MTPRESYAAKLIDPRWKQRRLQILIRDNYQCQQCGCRKRLEVHHRYYLPGRDPWNFPDDALTVLCHDCHSARHKPAIDWGAVAKWAAVGWVVLSVIELLR